MWVFYFSQTVSSSQQDFQIQSPQEYIYNAENITANFTTWTPLILHKIYLPVDPRSLPPPSSILDQFGVDFPLEALSVITSRLSEDIGEWRLPTNLLNENKSVKSKQTGTHFSKSTSEKFLIAL